MIAAPAMVSGRLDKPGESDVLRCQVRKGQKLSIRVESRCTGCEFDPLLQLSDSQGKVLAQADDAEDSADPELTHTFSADGECEITIRDLHDRSSARFAYRLTIEGVEPNYQLSLASDAFATAAGEELEIPVTISRTEGFAEEIEVRRRGASRGRHLRPGPLAPPRRYFEGRED